MMQKTPIQMHSLWRHNAICMHNKQHHWALEASQGESSLSYKVCDKAIAQEFMYIRVQSESSRMLTKQINISHQLWMANHRHINRFSLIKLWENNRQVFGVVTTSERSLFLVGPFFSNTSISSSQSPGSGQLCDCHMASGHWLDSAGQMTLVVRPSMNSPSEWPVTTQKLPATASAVLAVQLLAYKKEEREKLAGGWWQTAAWSHWLLIRGPRTDP